MYTNTNTMAQYHQTVRIENASILPILKSTGKLIVRDNYSGRGKGIYFPELTLLFIETRSVCNIYTKPTQGI